MCLIPPLAATAAQTRSIDAATINQALSQRFPVSRCVLPAICAQLRQPLVRLVQGDPRIYLQLTVRPDLGPLGADAPDGRIEMRGRPRYDPAEGTLYMDDAEALSVQLDGVPDEGLGMLREVGTMVMREWLQTQPIWKWDESDPQQALGRLLLQSVEVVDGRLLLRMGQSRQDTVPRYEDEP